MASAERVATSVCLVLSVGFALRTDAFEPTGPRGPRRDVPSRQEAWEGS
jgi:hypothetical protein